MSRSKKWRLEWDFFLGANGKRQYNKICVGCIQPYNAANYDGRPSTLRALWGLCHTTDPAKAKPWVDAYGTSGMYMTGECYKAADGKVYRCKQDNCVYDVTALPSAWEEV